MLLTPKITNAGREAIGVLPGFMLFLMVLSCGGPPEEVRDVLSKAESNRGELEKVIEHYRQGGNDEKLRAAYFLIGNMRDKVTLDGKAVRNFDVIFDILDSLHRKNVRILPVSPVVERVWDSLAHLYGTPNVGDTHPVPDYRIIKSQYLIDNIEQAFALRTQVESVRKLSFDQFCEYILPYRIGTERLEPWRDPLYKRYETLRDSLNSKNSYHRAEAINTHLKSYLYTNHAFWSYPFDMPVSKMEKGKRGSCKHIVFYTAAAMRANGVPVGVDMAPHWGNYGKGHEWNVLLQEDGRHFPFDAARVPFGGINECPYKPAKVFRITFAPQDRFPADDHALENDVPAELLDRYRKDVTEEYTKTFDFRVRLAHPTDEVKRYAVLCTFNNREWIPMDAGKIEGDSASFTNMGSELAYLAMYYLDGVLVPASEPFILEANGEVRYLTASASAKQDMILKRKFPCFPSTQEHLKTMLGMRFQGANRPDFSDSVNLFTVNTIPSSVTVVPVHAASTFRYVRCVSVYGKRACVAELEFFGGAQKTDAAKLTGKVIGFPEVSPHIGNFYQNAFDTNLETFFQGGIKNGYGWAGLDLGKPKRVTAIRYCPRSDTNFIIDGNTYELCVWIDGSWASMGKQVATGPLLKYSDVPAGGLYVLHNLTRGKEERIFTYENGEQVWY